MARSKRTDNDYIFSHPESRNLYIRLRDHDGRRFVKSLRTTDRAVAQVIALPMIAEHKARLLASRAPEGVAFRYEYEPGREHPGPDGGRVIATTTELIYLDADGKIRARGPNGGIGFAIPAPGERPSVPVKNSDDALLETYLKHKGITGLPEKQARDVWHTFKTVIGKPLAKCTRDDGRALVAAFGDIKSGTAHRRLVPMVALCNLAIAEGKLTFNPFAGCTDNGWKRRVPFTEDDVKLMRANIGKLDKTDQLLVRVLATMGVRRGEGFAIDREQVENDVRFCIVGTKTDQSLRRVPFPKNLLPHLPKKISGPLFTGRLDSAGKRLRKWLGDIGISDPTKAPMHSFRHRAADRLRAAGCPADIREELLGHERKTVAAGYGEGHPVPVLRKWIDKIGF
jgi:integrase